MLIVFPLGLLAMAIIFDVIAMALGNGYWSIQQMSAALAGYLESIWPGRSLT